MLNICLDEFGFLKQALMLQMLSVFSLQGKLAALSLVILNFNQADFLSKVGYSQMCQEHCKSGFHGGSENISDGRVFCVFHSFLCNAPCGPYLSRGCV